QWRYLITERPLNIVKTEYLVEGFQKLATVFLIKPPITDCLSLGCQPIFRDAWASLSRHLNTLPALPLGPFFVEESAFPERCGEQYDSPTAHRKHGSDREVERIFNAARFVHNQ